MPKFNVTGAVTASKFLGVFEADTAEEAVAKALESDECYCSVCHECARDIEDPEIHEAVASLIED